MITMKMRLFIKLSLYFSVTSERKTYFSLSDIYMYMSFPSTVDRNILALG